MFHTLLTTVWQAFCVEDYTIRQMVRQTILGNVCWWTCQRRNSCSPDGQTAADRSGSGKTKFLRKKGSEDLSGGKQFGNIMRKTACWPKYALENEFLMSAQITELTFLDHLALRLGILVPEHLTDKASGAKIRDAMNR